MKTNFKPIKKQRHLEMALESISGHPKPKIELEQYHTPSIIASDVLWNAYNLGDIEDKNVIDLGCGTGIFALGSAMLGAECACGIDIDLDALIMARETSEKLGLNEKINFIEMDINNISSEKIKFMDTCIQNPPFGSQLKVKKGADRIFMEKAIHLANVVYSFHMAETEDFVENYFSNLGGKITQKFYYTFSIPRTYSFHKQEAKKIEVIVVRVERINK
ncbi:MAG: METTL5 family protein [Methanobacteriaceae archaeon]|jgi:putative methylase|nr:METTL5 family protein [Methanobacteriaceae archaeon]MDO9626475.1 METTL5 family protein [Methanobacteriaceae archaeon]